jgi:hypothetical protein
MKSSPWIAPVFLGVALASVYLLPKAGQTAQSAVVMELPEARSGWIFKALPPSEAELGTLEKDTEFAKAVCLRPRPGEWTVDGYQVPDRVDISVVLSGYDLNNSIHRPERCMPAQGHNITSSKDISLRLNNDREITVRRLQSVQTIQGAKEDASSASFQCLTYYFFVGHDRITHDHFGRTMIDMKDRLLRGMDQRWAYVSASMWYGKMPWIEEEVSEQEADEKLREFVRDFAESQIRWEQLSNG